MTASELLPPKVSRAWGGGGRPVVLVGHSYGGPVITEAAAGNESVAALVYVNAFVPEHGQTAFDLSTEFPGSTLADALEPHPLADGGVEFAIQPVLFHQQFCADVPEGTATLLAATQRPVPVKDEAIAADSRG